MRTYDPFSGEGRFFRGNLHTHTTRSDGSFSLEDTVRIYKELGYDFLCITDHRRYYNDLGSSMGLTLLPGMEADGFVQRGPDRVHHLVCIGEQSASYAHDQRFETESYPNSNKANQSIAQYAAHGNLIALAHPNWSRVSFDQIKDLRGLWAMEVFNYGCDLENDTGFAQEMWDAYLSQGTRIHAIATDDGHQLPHLGGGWVWVYAKDNSPQSLITSLKEGRFYSSTGPEIKQMYIEDGMLHMECSPCARIMFRTNSLWENSHFVTSQSRVPVTKASFPVDKIIDYLRFTVVDAAGKYAWSPAIFKEDLPL